VFMWNGLLMIN